MEKREFKFRKIDAFTMNGSAGNGAAGVYLEQEEDISEEEMLQIAYELKGFISEVVYLFPSANDDYEFNLRFFSCEKEVPFCGHGTIAVMYDYIKDKGICKKELRIKTKKGLLTVYNLIQEKDAVFITAPDPVYHSSSFSVAETAEALSIDPESISNEKPVSLVNAGLNTLLVPLNSVESCINASPDYNRIRDYCLRNNVEIVTIYTAETVFTGNSYRTRVFAPSFGYLEDPATGSGNAALACFLYSRGFWDGTLFSIEQGINRNRPNIIKLYYDESLKRVVFGGMAECRIKGKYIL